MILIDTGPLVSLFDPKDRDHRHCHAVLNDISEPLYTTEAVLTEILHMLNAGSRGAQGIQEFFLQDYVTLTPLDRTMLQRCFEFMDKYADLPMDFADATLLVLAEKYRTNKVLTLDFQDFRTYQFKKGHRYYPLDLLGSDLLE
jgi:uncharacterized protein